MGCREDADILLSPAVDLPDAAKCGELGQGYPIWIPSLAFV
jgi:hypothetical protein